MRIIIYEGIQIEVDCHLKDIATAVEVAVRAAYAARCRYVRVGPLTPPSWEDGLRGRSGAGIRVRRTRGDQRVLYEGAS